MLKWVKYINFIEGVKWMEVVVGINVIGIVLEIEEVIMISGIEYYFVVFYSWSCVVVFIYNDDGKLIGILDFFCLIEFLYLYMFGMVILIVYVIECECSIRVY